MTKAIINIPAIKKKQKPCGVTRYLVAGYMLLKITVAKRLQTTSMQATRANNAPWSSSLTIFDISDLRVGTTLPLTAPMTGTKK
jgi:hypothetical protein